MSDWEILDGNIAEKTAAFGGNPVKTHRVYGTDKRSLRRNMEDFDARLERANAPVAEEPVEEPEDEDLEAGVDEDTSGVDAAAEAGEITNEAPEEPAAEVTATEEDGA